MKKATKKTVKKTPKKVAKNPRSYIKINFYKGDKFLVNISGVTKEQLAHAANSLFRTLEKLPA